MPQHACEKSTCSPGAGAHRCSSSWCSARQLTCWKMKQNPSRCVQVKVLQGQGVEDGAKPWNRARGGSSVSGAPFGQVLARDWRYFGRQRSWPCAVLTPAPPGSILSPTSDSSCLTAHSNPAQQFRQGSEEACIQLKPQGGIREAEGNFPSWNMASIQGLISGSWGNSHGIFAC